MQKKNGLEYTPIQLERENWEIARKKNILGIIMDSKLNENNKVTLPNNAEVLLASVWNNKPI